MSLEHHEQFQHIYNDYYRPLLRYLNRLTRNVHDAADMAQEVFMRLYGRSNINPELVQGWLFKTGYHLFVDDWRRRSRQVHLPLEQLPERETEEASPERLFLQNEQKAEINLMLDKLKPRDQMVLRLLEREGASYQEIADTFGFTEQNVKSVVFRARTKMRRMRGIQ